LHEQALELGLDCAVEVRDEDELERALERVDPEIFLLSPIEREDDETALEVVLDLLAAVPAGKLAIADLQLTNADEVAELERAGCDAVIVHAHAVAQLAGETPPEV
jgi:indole-3-glycerol phosphate synthase